MTLNMLVECLKFAVPLWFAVYGLSLVLMHDVQKRQLAAAAKSA